jgi:hypothetical protein
MLAATRTAAASRLAAACVALALSGAPSLATALARPAARACACASHSAKARCCPGCHGAAGRGTRAAKHHNDGERGCPKVACGSVQGSCGTPEARTASPRVNEDFTLTEAVALGSPARAEPLAPDAASPLEAARVPDVPPPRRA